MSRKTPWADIQCNTTRLAEVINSTFFSVPERQRARFSSQRVLTYRKSPLQMDISISCRGRMGRALHWTERGKATGEKGASGTEKYRNQENNIYSHRQFCSPLFLSPLLIYNVLWYFTLFSHPPRVCYWSEWLRRAHSAAQKTFHIYANETEKRHQSRARLCATLLQYLRLLARLEAE